MQLETNNNKEQHLACVAIVPCVFRAENKELVSKTARKMALFFHFSVTKTENLVRWSFFVQKPNGNACYAGEAPHHVIGQQSDLFVHAPASFTWYSISWQPLGLV